MLTAPPEGHDARGRPITCVGMVVSHDQLPGRYQPIGRPRVASPPRVVPQHGVFHIRSRNAEQISLHEGVIRPDNDARGSLRHATMFDAASDGGRSGDHWGTNNGRIAGNPR